MANLVVVEKNNDAEGYEEPLNPHADGVVAAGFYPQPAAGPLVQDVGVERDGSGRLVLKDGVEGPKTLSQIVAAGTGVTAEVHKTLLQLIHFIDEGPAEGFASGATKTTTGTVFPTEELWKRADNTALVRKTTTWSGVVPTTIEWKVYAADGTTVLATITDTITYNGVFETSRSRAIA